MTLTAPRRKEKKVSWQLLAGKSELRSGLGKSRGSPAISSLPDMASPAPSTVTQAAGRLMAANSPISFTYFTREQHRARCGSSNHPRISTLLIVLQGQKNNGRQFCSANLTLPRPINLGRLRYHFRTVGTPILRPPGLTLCSHHHASQHSSPLASCSLFRLRWLARLPRLSWLFASPASGQRGAGWCRSRGWSRRSNRILRIRPACRRGFLPLPLGIPVCESNLSPRHYFTSPSSQMRPSEHPTRRQRPTQFFLVGLCGLWSSCGCHPQTFCAKLSSLQMTIVLTCFGPLSWPLSLNVEGAAYDTSAAPGGTYSR